MSACTTRVRNAAPFAVSLAVLLLTGCAAYIGDRLLKLPQEVPAQDVQIIEQAQGRVRTLIGALGLTEERAKSLLEISPEGIIRNPQLLESSFVDRQLILTTGDTTVAFATNSIILVLGTLHVSHGGNNVIVADGDVDISHDGSLAQGSLVVSRGRVTVGHAADTLVYAPGGVEISHANGVRAFNTPDRSASSGDIGNLTIKSLFREEARSGAQP